MKINRLLKLFFCLALFSSCKIKSVSITSPENSISIPIESVKKNEASIHYSVDDSEKVDKTIRENSINPAYIENDNGYIIDSNNSDTKLLYERLFIIEFDINQYCYPEIRNLYNSPNMNDKFEELKDNTKLKSTKLIINSESRCWLSVVDENERKGWINLGRLDPYEDDNWAIVGSFEMDGKKVMLRKYTHWFSVPRNTPAFDRPSLDGNILWQSERTDDNSQINLEPMCVASNTFDGKYGKEYWVKVKDSYGRIGWFPGDVLDIERGGYKYLSPESIVKMSIYEP